MYWIHKVITCGYDKLLQVDSLGQGASMPMALMQQLERWKEQQSKHSIIFADLVFFQVPVDKSLRKPKIY